MYPEGSCFGLDLIVDEIELSSLMVVLSLCGVSVLSRSAYPFGSGGIFWPLKTGTLPHRHLLQILLADHSRIESRYVAL